MKGFWRAAIGFAVIATVVFSENLFGRELNDLFLMLPGIDKVLHTAEYFAVFLAVFWLAGRVAGDARQRVGIAAAAGVLLAVTDEFTQRLFANRNFELFDLGANMAGLTLGWIAVARPPRRLAAAAAIAALTTAAYVSFDTHLRLSDYAQALRHERRQEFTKAREDVYLRAIANGMRNPSIYNELAWVSVEGRAGTPEEAVAYAKLAYEGQPDNPDVLDTYGWALHYAGRSREALPFLETAFERNPQIFCIHYHLGEVYAALSLPDLAERHFRQQMTLRGTREAALAEQSLTRLSAAQAVDAPGVAR